MAGVPGRSGGARAGSGPKSKAEKHPQAFQSFEQRLVDGMAERLDALEELAEGGFPMATDTYEAAVCVLKNVYDDILDEDGNPTGKYAKRQVPAFPDKEPDELVLVKRVVSIAAQNMAANVYLLNRAAGTPTGEVEAEGEQEVVPFDLSKLTSEELHEYRRLTAKCTQSEDAGRGGSPA